MVDFVLSNLVNAGYLKIVVLTQYKSHSLDRHITKTWRMSNLLGNYVTPVPAQQRLGPCWFAGSADAIYQSFNLINDERPDYVIVFGADHIYRMDPEQMVADHIASGAGGDRRRHPPAAGAGRPVRRHRGRPRTAGRSRRSARSPPTPSGCPTRRTRSTRRWATTSSPPRRSSRRSTARRRGHASKHDMGGSIIPMLVERGEANVYDFRDNDVPGQHRPRPRLLARRRDARLVLRRPHGPDRHPPGLQPLQLRLADLHREPPVAAGEVRARLAGAGRPGDRLDGLARARSSPARWWRTRSSRRTSGCTRGRTSTARCSWRASTSAGTRWSATPSWTRTSSCPRAPRSASTWSATAALHRLRQRHRRHRQGPAGRALTTHPTGEGHSGVVSWMS